jgi:hypothetical protein
MKRPLDAEGTAGTPEFVQLHMRTLALHPMERLNPAPALTALARHRSR